MKESNKKTIAGKLKMKHLKESNQRTVARKLPRAAQSTRSDSGPSPSLKIHAGTQKRRNKTSTKVAKSKHDIGANDHFVVDHLVIEPNNLAHSFEKDLEGADPEDSWQAEVGQDNDTNLVPTPGAYSLDYLGRIRPSNDTDINHRSNVTTQHGENEVTNDNTPIAQQIQASIVDATNILTIPEAEEVQQHNLNELAQQIITQKAKKICKTIGILLLVITALGVGGP